MQGDDATINVTGGRAESGGDGDDGDGDGEGADAACGEDLVRIAAPKMSSVKWEVEVVVALIVVSFSVRASGVALAFSRCLNANADAGMDDGEVVGAKGAYGYPRGDISVLEVTKT